MSVTRRRASTPSHAAAASSLIGASGAPAAASAASSSTPPPAAPSITSWPSGRLVRGPSSTKTLEEPCTLVGCVASRPIGAIGPLLKKPLSGARTYCARRRDS